MVRVLVIEDNPITRKLARITLDGEGYEVVEAETGAMALEEMRRKPFDLVLQDLGLCDMDGFDLVSRLRGLAVDGTPILAFTGLRNLERIQAAGFDDLLVKPVEPSRLVETVRAHLAGSRHRTASSTDSVSAAGPREQALRAITSMLARLTELTGGTLSVEEIVSEILAAFLDASGFPIGAAYIYGPDGMARLCAHIGLLREPARIISSDCEHHRLPVNGSGIFTRDCGCSVHEALERTGVPVSMTVPLSLRDRHIGELVLGSANDRVDPEWNTFANVVAGPIAQTIMLAATVSQLAASEHKFRGIAESTADGIVVTDSSGEIKYINPVAEQLLGYGAIQQTLADSIQALSGARSCDAWRGHIKRADGRKIPIEVSMRSIENPPGDTNRVYVMRDLSERIQMKEFAHRADHDPLTGLFNRRRFEHEFGVRLAECRRYGTSGALLVLDLDRFKPINEWYGHPAGDAILNAVAEILQQTTRESDMTARLGGDEFVVLLNHADSIAAQICASKLLDRISSLKVQYKEHTLSVGASIGIALFPGHGLTQEDVLGAADKAMLRSKLLGRGRVSIAAEMRMEDAACIQLPQTNEVSH